MTYPQKAHHFWHHFQFLVKFIWKTLGRRNQDKIEYVIYIAFSIMYFWLIPLKSNQLLIFVSCVSSLYFFQEIRNGAAKVHITISGVEIYYTLSSAVPFFIGKISKVIRDLSVISFKYYYYSWICMTEFPCYLLLGSHALIFCSTKI